MLLPVRITHEPSAGAAYIEFRSMDPGEAIENLVIERPGLGTIVLDFNAAGTFLGVEIIGAEALAPPELLTDAEQL